MQGYQYGKGLINLKPIFRLAKLTFLRARATLKENTIYQVTYYSHFLKFKFKS